MHLRTNNVAAVVSVGVLTAGLLALGSVPGNAAPAKGWTPDPAQLGKLAPLTKVAGFQVRPPRGYAPQAINPGGGTITAWRGEARADGTRPVVMFQKVLIAPKEQNRYTLVQAFTMFMRSGAKGDSSYTQTPTQTGTLAGVPFVRASWSKTDPETGRTERGFNYMGRRGGGEFFLLGSQDESPDAAAALALAEASVLTFKPK